MKRLSRIMNVCLCIISINLAHAVIPIGEIPGYQIATFDQQLDRPLTTALWYPAAAKANNERPSPTTVADNAAFWGVNVIPNATIATGRHPLVVISHGYMGNYRNQAWLAASLAAKGYIVAAVNHPGTTTQDMNKIAAQALWRRPKDISVVIDMLLSKPEWADRIDAEQIYAIGHSLGAWTVMEMAGARFDHDQFMADCTNHPQLAACETYHRLNIAKVMGNRHHIEGDLHDARLKGVITLDIGLSRGFTDSSLAKIALPILIIAAGQPDRRNPYQLESEYLIERLPKDQLSYIRLDQARHFSFISPCKAEAVALLEKESPGDGFICQDTAGVNRRDIHQETINHIVDFLSNIGSGL